MVSIIWRDSVDRQSHIGSITGISDRQRRGEFFGGRTVARARSVRDQPSCENTRGDQGIDLFDRTSQKPTLTAVGRVLVDQARAILASADRFEAIAAGTRMGLEPALTLAIDPLVPTAPLIDSLRALRDTFPDLPVSFPQKGWAEPSDACGTALRPWHSVFCCRPCLTT